MIRELTLRDLPACAILYCRVFASPPWNEVWESSIAEARVRQVLEISGGFGLVLEEGDALLGFAVGYVEPWKQGYNYYLKEICIAPERQREGLGGAMVAELHRRLPGLGCNEIYLLTARGDLSEAFYQKLGYYTSDKMILMGKALG